MKKNFGPPKVSKADFSIHGELTTVKVVRDSKWCHWLDKEMWVFGHTIHVRGRFLVQRILRNGLHEMEARPLWKHRLFKLMSY